MKPATATAYQYINYLIEKEFDAWQGYPEQVGKVIDHCAASGHILIAGELTSRWNEMEGYNIYAAYKRGDFEFTPEYKAAKERPLTSDCQPGESDEPEEPKVERFIMTEDYSIIENPKYSVTLIEEQPDLGEVFSVLDSLTRPEKLTEEEKYDRQQAAKAEAEASQQPSISERKERLAETFTSALAHNEKMIAHSQRKTA